MKLRTGGAVASRDRVMRRDPQWQGEPNVTNTESDRWSERLSEYLDGDLGPRERADLERHLETCVPCREILEDLRALVANAARLENAAPEADLWPGIAHRLTERPQGLRARLTHWLGGGTRFVVSLPQLAAAAALLILISGGGVWFAMRRGPLPVPASEGTTGTSIAAAPLVNSQSRQAAPLPVSSTSARGADAQSAGYSLTRYDATIGELQRAITDHRGDLDTTTVRVIEQNLALIDQAIVDARRALAADPSNSYLNGYLTQQLQRKVRLLQKAAVLAVEHKG